MWRTAALIGALLALGSWVALCLVAQPQRIEETLRLETERALAAAGLGEARAVVSGRDAALEGRVASPDVRAEAELRVTGVAGIRKVDNRLTVRAVASSSPPPLTYLEVSARAGGMRLRGAVPNEALRREIVDRARLLVGIDQVDERLAVDAAVPGGAALAGAAGVVSALAGVDGDVRARLKGDSLRLSGIVASAAARRRIEQEARLAAPGVRLFFSALTVREGDIDGEQTPGERESGGS